MQIGCDLFSAFLSVFNDHGDDGHITLIIGISLPIISIFLILFEATKVKVEASEIPVLLHSIRKNKTEEELYEIVRDILLILFMIIIYLISLDLSFFTSNCSWENWNESEESFRCQQSITDFINQWNHNIFGIN